MKALFIALLFTSITLYSQQSSGPNDSTKVNQTSIQIINSDISKLDSSNSVLSKLKKDSIIIKGKSFKYNDLKVRGDSTSVNKKNIDKEKAQSESDTNEGTITNKNFFEGIKLCLFPVVKFIIELLFVLFFLFSIFYILKKYKKFRNEFSFLLEENERLLGENKNLNVELLNLKKTLSSSNRKKAKFKSITERESVRQTVINNLSKKNNLDSSQLARLKENQENRWITIGHSAIGKNHKNVIPIIPCQDSHHFQTLNAKFELAVVCDGAGSAKRSHFGSEFISQKAIPENINLYLENLEWFKKGEIPSKQEWSKISLKILKKSLEDLKNWIQTDNQKNNTKFSVDEYATTVIITLYNSKGVLVANIGDGRAGYLNNKGKLIPLFTPYSGEESNGTIFITSPIWGKTAKFVQSNVFPEDILSVFLLSDGMEKSTFECSNFTENVFVDPNIPYKDFFFPIFSKIKSISKVDENKLEDEWKMFLESGTASIKNEGDDKTLLISFLK